MNSKNSSTTLRGLLPSRASLLSNEYKSQLVVETHPYHASHSNPVTHREVASQNLGETHPTHASHILNENQRGCASHLKNENHSDNASSTLKFVGRIVAGAYYDSQQVRIATKNRIRDIIRKKVEGIAFDEVEEKKDKKTRKKKYTDKQMIQLWDNLLEEKKITKKEHEYVMNCWDIIKESERIENEYKKTMMLYISEEPVYIHFLSKVRGIGPVLSTNLIKEFGDCSRYDYISSLWKHTGNHVTENGKAPKLRKGENIEYNPRLRTLTWKISDCLMKLNKGVYRQIYNTEKQKQLAIEYKEGELLEKFGKPYKKKDTNLRKGHAHNRALRKMRKLFLSHFWTASRELNNLPLTDPYSENKLGHKHIISWKEAVWIEEGI